MIIEFLISGVFTILEAFISVFEVPAAPDDFLEAIPEFFTYLESAKNLIALVFPINLEPFLYCTLAILAIEHGYPFIMWVLRKIPFLGIE